MGALAHSFVDSAMLPSPLLTNALSMDEAPKLSHSIAIALDEALDRATLPAQTAAGLMPILISDAEYMDGEQLPARNALVPARTRASTRSPAARSLLVHSTAARCPQH